MAKSRILTRKYLLFFFTIFVCISIVFIFWRLNNPGLKEAPSKANKPTITLKGKSIYVQIAESDSTREIGLSGRKNIDDNEGMLFIYEVKTIPTFWMKDMLFPIDIIWIENREVVDLVKNIPAPTSGTSESLLPRFAPPKPINYVLEVNAGLSDKNDLKIGDTVDLSNIR